MPSNPCPRCGKASATNSKYCAACLEKTRDYWADRRAKLPVGTCKKCCTRETAAGYTQCTRCRAQTAAGMQKLRAAHPERNACYQRDRNRKRRALVLQHYGGKCACCGEEHFDFLALDHIAGNGNNHRSEVRMAGASMVEWVIKNNFPAIFRVLCHNCNSAIGYYGRCPHQMGAHEPWLSPT